MDRTTKMVINQDIISDRKFNNTETGQKIIIENMTKQYKIETFENTAKISILENQKDAIIRD